EVTIRGITHVTGGGFYENFPRMLPAGLGVEIKKGSWEIPPIFSFLQEIGRVTPDEMYGIFNMGIGMGVVVAETDVDEALKAFKKNGEEAMVIGSVTPHEGVHFWSRYFKKQQSLHREQVVIFRQSSIKKTYLVRFVY